ncbi:MAG: WhiB family transcriptional regulator [Pseudonocardiaceae bacterium]
MTNDWMRRAACVSEDPELWFPIADDGPGLLQAGRAKAICRRCPVSTGCLKWAMTALADGVAGGLTARERATLRRGIHKTTPHPREGAAA